MKKINIIVIFIFILIVTNVITKCICEYHYNNEIIELKKELMISRLETLSEINDHIKTLNEITDELEHLKIDLECE
jgi:hypothetical protein